LLCLLDVRGLWLVTLDVLGEEGLRILLDNFGFQSCGLEIFRDCLLFLGWIELDFRGSNRRRWRIEWSELSG